MVSMSFLLKICSLPAYSSTLIFPFSHQTSQYPTVPAPFWTALSKTWGNTLCEPMQNVELDIEYLKTSYPALASHLLSESSLLSNSAWCDYIRCCSDPNQKAQALFIRSTWRQADLRFECQFLASKFQYTTAHVPTMSIANMFFAVTKPESNPHNHTLLTLMFPCMRMLPYRSRNW